MKTWIFIGIFLISSYCQASKWLITISTNTDLPAEFTQTLEQELSTKLNGYEHKIQLTPGTVGRQQVTDSIRLLNQEIKLQKENDPNHKVRLVISLSGHGSSVNNRFTFKLNKGPSLTGDEIVEMVNSIKADEIILMVESCFSGSLIENHFKKASLRPDQTIIVITSASENIKSSYKTWSQEVLSQALTSSADFNSDNLVSYDEFKNGLLLFSARNAEYIPSEKINQYSRITSPTMGLDTEIFEHNLPASLTINTLSDDCQTTCINLENELYQETIEQINLYNKLFDYLYQAKLDDVMKMLPQLPLHQQRRIAEIIMSEDYAHYFRLFYSQNAEILHQGLFPLIKDNNIDVLTRFKLADFFINHNDAEIAPLLKELKNDPSNSLTPHLDQLITKTEQIQTKTVTPDQSDSFMSSDLLKALDEALSQDNSE